MKPNKILLTLACAVAIFIVCDNLLNYVMMRGVNNYYGLNCKANVLLIGHSHLMLATDKSRLEKETGLAVAKYCREGVNCTDRKTMVEHFLNNGNADSLKVVLYGVDLYSFSADGLSKNAYQLFYPFIDNKYIDKYLQKYAPRSDYWLHKIVKTTRFNNDGMKNSVWRGWADNWDNLKFNTIDVESYRKQLADGNEREIKMNPQLIKDFKSTVEMLTDRGIKVILVNTPTIDILNSYHGDKYRQIIRWYADYADTSPLIEFWDLTDGNSDDHTIFSDRIHLNARGQQKITTQLIDSLRSLNLN